MSENEEKKIEIPDNYIYWQGKRVPPYKELSQTKQQILKKHLAAVKDLKKKTARDLFQAGVSQEDVEDILSGRIFDNMKQLETITADQIPTNISWPADVKAAYNFLNTADKEFQTIQDLIDKLETFFSNLSNEQLALLEEYEKVVVDRFVSGQAKRIGNRAVTAEYSVENRILDSIIGRYQDKLFKVNKDLTDAGLNKKMMKLYMLYKNLQSYQGSHQTTLRFKGQKAGNSGSIGDADILEGVVAIAKSYVGGYNKVTTEYAAAYGLIGGHKRLLKALPGMSVTPGGQSSGAMTFQYSPEVQKMIDEAEAIEQKTVVSKPDLHVHFSGNNVTGIINISVKEYDNVSYSSSGLIKNVTGIKVQDGTSLLVLMAREAEFSAKDILHVMRVAAATDMKADNSGKDPNGRNLSKDWDDLKEVITFSSILSAVAGLAQSTNGQNLYMLINKQVIGVEEVIKNIMTNKDNKALRLSYASKKGSNLSQGLAKETYENINKQHYISEGETTEPAPHIERSKKVYSDILKKMYATKIKISLNLIDLVKEK